ncbi:MAG: sulfatase, partial [Planctomycetota bacterium]|nr:sulfatase [Planctomycetota bacterium]
RPEVPMPLPLHRAAHMSASFLALAVAACTPTAESAVTATIRLADDFDADLVEGGAGEVDLPEPVVMRFDGPPPEPETGDEEDQEETEDGGEKEEEPDFTPTYGFEAFLDVEDLAVVDGLLTGTTGEIPVLRVGLEPPDEDDQLHAIEVRLRVSAGGKLGVLLSDDEEVKRDQMVKRLRRSNFWMLSADVTEGDDLRTVTVDLGHAPSARVGDLHHLFLQPIDAEGADFAIEEVRLVTRREHLASIPSGVSWQGLEEIYRETLVLRAPEEARIPATLPADPWLDLAIGTIEPQPATFHVSARIRGTGEEIPLLRRTVTTAERWEKVPLDLSPVAGRDVDLVFRVESSEPGTIGYFGTPVVRSREAPPPVPGAPHGVILIVADTLRRDHLDAYGYERETAPTLTRLAAGGALFLDDISQGTWTKVSVPSILSSIHPTSNGIVGVRDRLPCSVTTLSEVFQDAGYATFATSSVSFTGKLSNLHQGLDVLHERSSVGDLGHGRSKTMRVYLDRMLEWIEAREGGPFYARLHVFDPHDPFEPYAPYEGIWSAPDAKDLHEKAVKKVKAWQKENDEEENAMPRRVHLEAAEVSPEDFVRREIDWYDESIRAMDVELARLMERLEELGLADDVLIAFVSDHGEQFLEHGRHFHGVYTYGEMTNVPLILWGPRWVPPGTVVPDTVQSIDLMPTLIRLAGLRVPAEAQGQSLVPLMTGAGTWTPRPAISVRMRANFDREPDPDETESYSIVHDGYRLVHNVTRPEGWPEHELFDHVADPLNLNDVAAEHPDRVADLSQKLELWKRWAEANRIDAGDAAELTQAELAELEALGYGGN